MTDESPDMTDWTQDTESNETSNRYQPRSRLDYKQDDDPWPRYHHRNNNTEPPNDETTTLVSNKTGNGDDQLRLPSSNNINHKSLTIDSTLEINQSDTPISINRIRWKTLKLSAHTTTHLHDHLIIWPNHSSSSTRKTPIRLAKLVATIDTPVRSIQLLRSNQTELELIITITRQQLI